MNLIDIVRKYFDLRPPDMDSQRFFLAYRKGLCIRQPIGIHSIGGYPKLIATFLNLPNPGTYTGHCYRRSGVSLMAESGATLSDMRRHCGWVNESMAERYIEISLNNKRKIAGHILGMKPTSTVTSSSGMETVESTNSVSDAVLSTDEVAATSIPTLNTVNEVNSVRTVTVVQSQSQTVASSVTAPSNGSNRGNVASNGSDVGTVASSVIAETTSVTAGTNGTNLEIKVLSNCTINIYQK